MPAGLRAIQRRHRRGVFTPLQLPGLVAWYDASQIVGLNDADPVSTWADLSGLGHDLTATLTLRPLYKTAIVNGLPVVRFDGINDVMGTADFGLAKPCTVVLAFLLRSSVTAQKDLTDASGSGSLILGPISSNGVFQLGGGGLPIGSATILASTWYVGAGAFAGTGNSSVYLNNSAAPVTGNAGTFMGGGAFFVGARASGFGPSPLDTPEIIVVNGTMSAANLSATFSYLGNRYGIAAS